MITFLRGKIVEAIPTQAVIDVNGVGYEVLIPLSSLDKLPGPGQDVQLLTHLAVREDAHVLYGFMTSEEREIFRLLISNVKGIGPKLALNILSGTNPVSFKGAVANGDVKALSSISGVGKKTAERIVVDLKDRIGAVGAWEASSAAQASAVEDQKLNDAVSALIALGFKPEEAHKSVKGAVAMLGDSATVEELVRASLKK
ncbi:MAG: Holliday junction branch migration protein RuvA [Verrucomicrobiales bacterium]|nr:Holliday junction branch migration protein RuvA [Verrucomicrobiales bacterium]|tara:strand:- start:11399 stop:11998 length:600 start_codon:yes stop_codon:yes gene_type:complete